MSAAHTRDDTAAEVVRLLEPVLLSIDRRLTALDSDVADMKVQQRKAQDDLLEIKGQLKNVPTSLGMTGTMLAINAGLFALAGLLITMLKQLGTIM